METVELRQQFKEVCAATENRFQNFQIRVHRALSWYERALEMDVDTQPDGRLLYAWIAFNALYGSWDPNTGFPAKDAESYKAFLARTIAIDDRGLLAANLRSLRNEILALLDNRYLDARFWSNPQAPGNTRAKYHKATSLYFEERWYDILVYAVERIYVLRGQIVHGAATRGSSLNRASLAACQKLLLEVLPTILTITLEHGAHDNWPPLCYPPMEPAKHLA